MCIVGRVSTCRCQAQGTCRFYATKEEYEPAWHEYRQERLTRYMAEIERGEIAEEVRRLVRQDASELGLCVE